MKTMAPLNINMGDCIVKTLMAYDPSRGKGVYVVVDVCHDLLRYMIEYPDGEVYATARTSAEAKRIYDGI